MSTALITIEEFKEALPQHIRKNVQPEVVANINKAIQDPEVLAVYRENVIGLASVMKEGKFKLSDYLAAVKFVSYKLLGQNSIQAWAATFPDRYKGMTQRGNTRSEIAAIASRYNTSKLVTLLLEQTLIPTHIINAPLYQEAINTQAELMRSAKSETVRQKAGEALINALAPPETKKIELDISHKEDSTIEVLRETTLALARQQAEMLRKGGATPKAIAESRIIDITPEPTNE